MDRCPEARTGLGAPMALPSHEAALVPPNHPTTVLIQCMDLPARPFSPSPSSSLEAQQGKPQRLVLSSPS